MAINLDQYKNLDPNNPGVWPLPARAALLLVIFAVVVGAGGHFKNKEQWESHKKVVAKELELRDTFEQKQQRAASLEPLKRQLEEMKQSFGALLRLLPNKTEIEGLLVDISQAGLAAGLEFELFKPAPEVPQEFIAEQPIEIRVVGRYHEFGEFISAVAALPRIVTQHNVVIAPRTGQGGAEGGEITLIMDMVAKTYRYLEEDEK